ncbi:MAG: phospholipid/cholesterol/gamma-HCH transport system substrate-binding protein, partial [Betaproteobacteria bacterium]|nr:phospholipid/cholesterol/gamma-HCH transport system substrate-binding protein [Betaproteobacteria bacterium]
GKRYYRLGLFVVVCVTILAAVLFVLGGRKLFQPTFTFETYFNESVAGLELGAPVRFRGVPLGQVTQILTSAATYESDVPLEKRREYIVVRVKVNISAEEADQLKRDAPELVKKGLRAQTQLAGITGQQYLALDFMDAVKYPPLQFEWTPKHMYVPSAPSLAGEIVANAQAFLAKLNEVDIKTLGRDLNTLVVDVDRTVNEVSVAELSAQARHALENVNAAFARVDRLIKAAPIEQTVRRVDSAVARLDGLLADPDLKRTVENTAAISARVRRLTDDGDLDRMVKRIDDTAERLDGLIADNQYDVRVVVQDLRVTADNLRTLSETVKRYPAGALVGGPPDRIRLPETQR